jgi:cation diffusion facilitator family transporter
MSASSGRSDKRADANRPIALGSPLLAVQMSELADTAPRSHTAVIIEPTVAFSVGGLDRQARRAHAVSMAANVGLFVAKFYVYYTSRSMAILASLVDSTIDLLAQGGLMWANRASGSSDGIAYPAGRARLEPVAVVTCALLMAMASLQVIREASTELIDASRSGTVVLLELGLVDIVMMVGTIVLKAGLWLYCKGIAERTNNVTVDAVAQDNFNDILSNTVAVLAAGSTQLRPSFWLADPVGALVISVYIIFNWTRTGVEQVEMLVGRTADPSFLDVVREMAETHDPLVSLDMLRAYHFGPKFLVEIEIVMPEETRLRESHDVGIRLQHKIEALESVERCFVHIDYQLRCAPTRRARTTRALRHAARRLTSRATDSRPRARAHSRRDVDDHDPAVPLEYKTAEAPSQPRISPNERNRLRQVSFNSRDADGRQHETTALGPASPSDADAA